MTLKNTFKNTYIGMFKKNTISLKTLLRKLSLNCVGSILTHMLTEI